MLALATTATATATAIGESSSSASASKGKGGVRGGSLCDGAGLARRHAALRKQSRLAGSSSGASLGGSSLEGDMRAAVTLNFN